MNRTTAFASLVIVLACVTSLGLLAGCDAKKSSPDAKWLGTYKSAKEGGTLVLQPDHKGTLDLAGTKGDLTWEINADDKITVHAGIPIEMFRNSNGDLRDQQGTEWKKS